MEPPVIIRPLRPGDGDALHFLHLAAVLAAPEIMGGTPAAIENADTFEALIGVATTVASRFISGFIAERRGRPVGMILSTADGDCGGVELHSVWVQPEVRGQHVANRLVSATLTWAREAGWDIAEVWTAAGNDPAIRLYEQAGFELTGELRPLWLRPGTSEVQLVRHEAVAQEGMAL